MKQLFIYTLLSLLSGFVMGQDNIGKSLTSVIKETCSNTYIEVYPQSSIIKKTNRLLFFGAEVCESSTNEDVVSFCNNQFAYYEDGLILYTQEFSNEWYFNGKPKHILSMLSANLFVYTHYNVNGEKTGMEYFKHDPVKREFFINSTLSCEDHRLNLMQLSTICDKINYVQNVNSDHCLMEFIGELDTLTGHSPNLYLGLDGAYYSSDSLRQDDFMVWKSKCGCM